MVLQLSIALDTGCAFDPHITLQQTPNVCGDQRDYANGTKSSATVAVIGTYRRKESQMIPEKNYFTDTNVTNGTVTLHMCIDMANRLYYLKYIREQTHKKDKFFGKK